MAKSYAKKKQYQVWIKQQVRDGKGFASDGRVVPIRDTPTNSMQSMLQNGHGNNRA